MRHVERAYTLIDFTPPPGLWPDRDRVVRFMEHVRANFHRIVPGVPAESEADLFAGGTAHDGGPLPLLGLHTPTGAAAREPRWDRMIEAVSRWCVSLPPDEVERVASGTVAPTWDELVASGVHPARG